MVVVKSARLPDTRPWASRFAHHSWIDVKQGAEDRWVRVEIASEFSGVDVDSIPAPVARRDERWDRTIVVAGVLAGPEAEEAARAVLAAARRYRWSEPEDYGVWPGPNSNSFADWIGRQVPGLAFELDHNAVGKDFDGWLRAGGTTTKSGLELETPILGLQVGLREGVELHVIQLVLGVSLFPPALKLPFLPRIGWRGR